MSQLRSALICVAALLLTAAAMPDDAAVERLRGQIEKRQAERIRHQQPQSSIALKPLAGSADDEPDFAKAGRLAVVLVQKEWSIPAIAIRLIPSAGGEPVCIAAGPRADQWLALEPGLWRIEVTAARAGLSKIATIEAGEFRLNLREKYELNFGTAEKEEIAARLR